MHGVHIEQGGRYEIAADGVTLLTVGQLGPEGKQAVAKRLKKGKETLNDTPNLL